ncbi:MAG: hypothetical protein Q9187_006713 [Circinaria calcarea]
MARSPPQDTSSPDIDAINLSRALSRLEQKILSPTPNPRLLHSSFERAKTAANLEYARTLLLRREHATASIKIQSRKQAATNELLSQRKLLKRLNDRLSELGQQDHDSDTSAGEDILGEYAGPLGPSPDEEAYQAPLTNAPDTLPEPSTLRNRLRAPSSPSSTSTSNPNANTTATLLTSSSTTQAQLTTSLLTLTSALKASTLSFHAALEAEKPLLAQTAEALDKNSDGMAAAEKRMGLLRKMSEGQGWWGRMMLYAWIGGLWVLALGLVFVGPKLRF